MNSIKEFIGKEVHLFPLDTYKKSAILLEISEHGYLFEITKCEQGSGYRIGEIVFLNHSSKIQLSIK